MSDLPECKWGKNVRIGEKLISPHMQFTAAVRSW
jgi:hypothetical protein